jgi:UMF1 family MFS transporter
MSLPGTHPRNQVLSWALYDWANSAFATIVLAAFFPVFFKEYWNAGTDAAVSTFRLGAANSLASVAVALLAPLLGAVADKSSARKKFLLFFAAMGIVMTGSLYLVAQGHWLLAAVLFALALIGFSGGNIFYDALLVSVAPPAKADFVSALGYSLGYLGGGLLFALDVVLVLFPQTFGLADQAQAVRLAFVSVALWWGAFSIPLFLFVEEPPAADRVPAPQALAAGVRQLIATFQEIRRLRMVFLFLIAYWLYIDGVDTIIRMAVDYGLSLGFDTHNLLIALGITQFVGFPSAIAFGKLGEKLGARNGIFMGLGVYIGVTIWGFFMDRVEEFYALAIAVGLVQGGVQALSRSLYARLIPPQRSAEFFGFYNMLGKFAAVIGPLLLGWVGLLTGSPRHAILSIIFLFVIGALLLWRVDVAQGARLAADLEE